MSLLFVGYPYHRTSRLHPCDFPVTDSSLWKSDGKHRAPLLVILCANRPPLPGKNRFGKRQSDSIPCGIGVFPAIEPVKQAGQIFFFETRAAVMDGQLREQRRVLTGYFYFAAVAHAFHTIFKIFRMASESQPESP